MSRYTILPLIVGLLFFSRAAVAQHSREDDVDIIEVPAYRAADEKKPDLAAVAANIVAQTNAFREKENRTKVSENAKLAETAQAFAEYMAKSGRYGHTADGSNPADRASKKGYEYCV